MVNSYITKGGLELKLPGTIVVAGNGVMAAVTGTKSFPARPKRRSGQGDADFDPALMYADLLFIMLAAILGAFLAIQQQGDSMKPNRPGGNDVPVILELRATGLMLVDSKSGVTSPVAVSGAEVVIAGDREIWMRRPMRLRPFQHDAVVKQLSQAGALFNLLEGKSIGWE